MASSLVQASADTLPGGVATVEGFLTDATDHKTTLIVANGATDFIDVRGVRVLAITVVNGASDTCTFTVEGSADGTTFATAAYGQGSSAAYTKAALVGVAATSYVLSLPSDDLINYIRVNISDSNATAGTTFKVSGRS